MNILKTIETEIHNYKHDSVELFEGYTYSPYKVIRRIGLYKNQIYPTGKFDSQGNYKYWIDIISPRVNSEVKNIDFDTKDIVLHSEPEEDYLKVIISNVAMKDWLEETGEAEKINSMIEKGTEWGNVIFKRVKNDYITLNLATTYVLNPIAETLEDSDVIEYNLMFTSDLRKKDEWDKDKVKELIDSSKTKEKPEFHIYERNGEINEQDYNEAKGISRNGDENKYILVKIIVGGVEEGKPMQLLYVEEMSKKPYKEYHRSSFSGRWLRVGMYEILFDIQTRGNKISNQIASGLEYAAKTVFRSSDNTIAQNILTDMQNGDIIKSIDLQQVPTRMEGFDQLVADWNRLMIEADKLANSFEVVTGESLPSGTPFRLGRLQDQNASKLFDYIREKLGIVLQDVVKDWVLPKLLKSLKLRKILKLTGDSGYLQKYYQLLVENWYVQNLITLPPHTQEEALALKTQKIEELMENDETVVKLEKVMWDDFKPRVKVVITGENFNLAGELETLQNFVALEVDPIRRTALIEMAMKRKGLDVSKLPKSPPQIQPQTNNAEVPNRQLSTQA